VTSPEYLRGVQSRLCRRTHFQPEMGGRGFFSEIFFFQRGTVKKSPHFRTSWKEEPQEEIVPVVNALLPNMCILDAHVIASVIAVKFECKICKSQWQLSTFAQCDELQRIQCPQGIPHQCHVLRAVIE
jgi:hypothetical protein